MKILVLNSGSSSIKFQIFDMNGEKTLIKGAIEEIGTKNSKTKIEIIETGEVLKNSDFIEDHNKGVEVLFTMLKDKFDLNQIKGIGHRVVHGGELFTKSVIIDDNVIEGIDKLSSLAPLHNPGHLAGIKSVMNAMKEIPNVAVFDTVFHQTMPPYAYMYAIPYDLYEKYSVRKYGFHGTSHKYISEEAAKFMGIKLENFNAVSLHIGNGVSATAIKGGKSIDTSMGISPLEGLMMGTRSGDIDPAALEYISAQSGMSLKEIDHILNKRSGLLGVCGTNDIREVKSRIIKDNDERAKLAYSMYMYRLIKYIGSYFAVIGRVDAVLFTAGVGENYSHLREDICDKILHLGVRIDPTLNELKSSQIRYITKENSLVRALVVPTNEELAIAREVIRLIKE